MIMIKIKIKLYLKYWYLSDLYGWAVSQKLMVFSGLEIHLSLMKISTTKKKKKKNYKEDSDEGYFLEVDIQ